MKPKSSRIPIVMLAAVAAVAAAVASSSASCLPGDQSLPLGSVEFHLEASAETKAGLPDFALDDGYALTFDRVILGFDTVTIGDNTHAGDCSYHGRGNASDEVFDPRVGLVQIFNGIQPTACPDVGFILSAPGNGTTPGPGATPDDLFALVADPPADVDVEVTATRAAHLGLAPAPYHVVLRLDADRAVTRFGGCRAAQKGVRVIPNERQVQTITFGAEAFFREALGGTAALQFGPFVEADLDGDRTITTDELDATPLIRIKSLYGQFYDLGDGAGSGSFGDYVRAQLKFAFVFDGDGICVATTDQDAGP